MKRFLLPLGVDDPAVSAAIGCDRESVLGDAPEALTVTYLDTFDWRLHDAGMVLKEEHGRGRHLVLYEGDREPLVVPVDLTPRLRGDLPQGHLAEVVGPAMGIRALVVVGTVEVSRLEGRVDDGAGNMIARLRLERVQPIDASGRSIGPEFATLRMSDSELSHGLTPSSGARPVPEHDLVAAAAARGRAPGDYSPKLAINLDGGQSAGSAVRAILLDLATTLEKNVEGTIDDLDTEFLHDLRVACRRTRSALTQLKRVVPGDVIARYNPEFKWLGSVTGPLRDLDVTLLEMPATRATLPPHANPHLAPLEELIADERDRAQRSVATALRSDRFRTLLADWRATVRDDTAFTTAGSSETAADLADERIANAYRRIVKRGRRLGVDPPAAALHRLRIDGKKLRYLLEFFRSLYPEPDISERIKELKRLQDILGGFNDMEVQRERLRSFARALDAKPEVGTDTIMTLGRLAGTLDQRQDGYRSAFHEAFVEFSGRDVRDAYAALSHRKDPR